MWLEKRNSSSGFGSSCLSLNQLASLIHIAVQSLSKGTFCATNVLRLEDFLSRRRIWGGLAGRWGLCKREMLPRRVGCCHA